MGMTHRPSLLNHDRRHFLKTTSLATLGLPSLSAFSSDPSIYRQDTPGPDYKIKHHRIKQSVMGWCFNPMPMDELIDACHRMGMPAMEGISRNFYPKLRELGMKPAIVGSHGFANGPVNPDNREVCISKIKEAINVAVEYGSPNVITFTGMSVKGMSQAEGARNCIRCWKEVAGYAEDKGVNLCLEHLNSRDDTHPMKGHPGYFGDDVDFCIDLIEAVDSPRMKLLFDIYHVQVMNGDVTRRLRRVIDYIGHVHTAGVPGRAEIDETQELYYPAIMRVLLDLGYRGFVAQEFIPTWEDKLAALRHGVNICDVD